MPWFTQGDIDAMVGTAIRSKVSPTTADFNGAEGRARRKVRSAYLAAGYSVSDAAPTELAKDLAKAQWILERYGVRKGFVIPPAIADLINMLDMVRAGSLPDPDATVNTRDGIGGNQWTDMDPESTSTAARAPRFSRSELKRW